MSVSKKTENISFRQTPEEKELLIQIASEMETTPGSLASSIISRFLKAKLEHGNRLIWPPEFNYYPAGSQTAQKDP
jgi:basic membrane lipoprotein Med (substrate-binding protein (PBP1-ABC) superfamily)